MNNKLKIKKAVKKRFSVTKKGKVKRGYTGKLHMLEHKSKSSKRSKRKQTDLSKADHKKLKKVLSALV
ncbi:50S ribosomal protein L35 [bacterium]|nr:50S ribosomal protein L35 [bacterium]MBT4552429.1 50S ribosomal protein L35 [bacterium]MBT7088032.1 50S ribosomal protein L35 [bacterium]